MRLIVTACAGLALPAATAAQGAWEALLSVDPYPSPYYSDWDVDPTIGTLTVFNHGAVAGDVRVAFSIMDRSNRVIASGLSETQRVPAGAAAIFESPYDVAGTTSHDTEIERIAERTGRLPEGEYTACAAATDIDGFVLAEACAQFSILYPDPPLLLSPADDAVLEVQDELFQWSPVQVPAQFQPQYVLRIVEVLDGQTPAEALASNIPHHESLELFTPTLRYPIEARPFEPGPTYAWSVRAFDQNGYPLSANEGRSEIWTFRYDDGTGPVDGPVATTFALSTAGQAGPTSPSLSLNQICTTTRVGDVVLDVRSPLGFDPLPASSATLYRDAGGEDWWLFTERQNRQLLLHGSCSSLLDERLLGGLRWVAARKTGRNQRINDWLSVNVPPVGVESIDYGLFVLALKGGTLDVPSSFLEGSQFLAGHDIEVLRGLNAYAVLNLHEHAMWPLLERLGYREKQIEIQGFAGFDAEKAVSVGGAGELADGEPTGDAEVTANVTTEQTFLTLRAALPERTPIGPLAGLIESMRLGVELAIERETDTSLGVAREEESAEGVFDVESELALVPRLTHTMTLRSDRFPNVRGSRDLVGTFGLGLARVQETENKAKQVWMRLQRSSGAAAAGLRRAGSWFGANPDSVICAPKPTSEQEASLVMSYAMDGEIVLGSFVIEEPALEVKVQLAGDGGQVVSGDDRSLSFAVAAVLKGADWGENGIATGVTVEREKEDAAEEICSPRPRSNATVTMTRPRSDATVGQTRPRSNAVTERPPTTEAPDSATWEVEWRVGTEAMPLGDLLRGIPNLIRTLSDAIRNP
jgi:hypothetical protein